MRKVDIEYNQWLNTFLLYDPGPHEVIGSLDFEYDPGSSGYGLMGKIIVGSQTILFNKSLEIIGPIIVKRGDSPLEYVVSHAVSVAIRRMIDGVLEEMDVEAYWGKQYGYLAHLVQDMVAYWVDRTRSRKAMI